MQLLLDQGLPRTAAKLLRNAGIDTLHVGEIGMAAAKDIQILRHAESEKRIVITLDSDFHTLLAQDNSAVPSVIRVRIEGLKSEAFAFSSFAKLHGITTIIESGVANGVSTESWLQTIPNVIVHGLDIFFQPALQRLEEYKQSNRLFLHQGDSRDELPKLLQQLQVTIRHVKKCFLANNGLKIIN